MKFCVDCKNLIVNHRSHGRISYFCGRKELLDPVTKRTIGEQCSDQRANENGCGKEGKYFEPKVSQN
jgi:hypothetical protein